MPLSLFNLHGDLAELRFPRLLAALFQDRFTGVLQATCRESAVASDPAIENPEPGDITREVHFADGHIAWAISTDPDESLKAYLLRGGNVTPAQWADAEQRAREGSLREALVSAGLVSGRELGQIERGRVENIVLSMFAPRAGDYRIRERQIAPGTADLHLDPRPLILRGIPEWADRTLVIEEIGSLDAIYSVRRATSDDSDLLLPQEYTALLRYLDGESSIAQVIARNSLPDHYVCSLFAALSLAGVIRKHQEKPAARARAGASEVLPAPAAESAPLPPARQMELPPIATGPFPGDGPMGELEPSEEAETAASVAPEADLEAEWLPPEVHDEAQLDHDLVIADGEEIAPEEEDYLEAVEPDEAELDPEPLAPIPAPPSAYAADSIPDSSRPWFLLGGGAAVGIAALFLILMTQGPSESMEQPVPAIEPAVALPAAALTEPDEADDPPGSEIAENPPLIRHAPPARPPASPAASSPARPRRSDPVVAAPAGRPILKPGPANDAAALARRSLSEGDYAGAARHYSRTIRSSPPLYSVQIMAACQPETIRSVVQRARGSSQLFLLPATLQGRDCYRIYWGRYRSYESAQEALRRDVPATLRQADTPRVARVSGA